jgi:hypothetical protein
MTRRPAIVFATRSGSTTMDQDAQGGNPFATALLEVASDDRVSFQQIPRRLRALTVRGSQGHQVPEWTGWPRRVRWSFQLLIVSDYSRAGLTPLTGAAHDERRISTMLAANGFSVVQGIAPTRTALLRALVTFGRQARRHDVAVVYCTGHGFECAGRVYLLPGDYPLAGGCSSRQLNANAITVDRIAAACRAAKLNLVFFAGCRTLGSNRAAVRQR